MNEEDYTGLMSVLLAHFIQSQGGIIDMDAEEILTDIKSGKNYQIRMTIKQKQLRLEVLDERESEDTQRGN